MANSYFNAFISYRHSPVDTAVAVEIQKKLERFHIPSQIQKKYGIKKFERIFRDTSELEITNDLAAQLDDAIRASDFLIVICSPRYMESPWCLREIEVFLQTHPRDHVLCVMAEGEPPGIFPPVLMQEAEPLACDYRGSFREAEKVELPRLACAMIGCSYDELIMRTTQYKRRRTTALVSVILTLAAIAVSYLLYSNARIRAQYQQTLINESKTLAAQSLEAMSARDRYHALSYALEALPSEDLDRPVTSEAVYALHKASGAYSLPYQVVQTKLFDGIQDFEKLVVLEKSGCLAAMDSSGKVFVYDISSGELLSSFSGYPAGQGSESLPSLIATAEDLLVTAWNGIITAHFPDGTLAWSQTLGYTEEGGLVNYGNPIHASSDGKTISCGDLKAIQVMSATDGTPIASYRIPEGYPDKVLDFAWSPNEFYLAVQIRLDDGNDAFYILEAEHGTLSPIEGEFAYVADFHWNDLGQLLIFCRPSEQSSYTSGTSYEYLYFQEMSVFAYASSGEAVFDLTIPLSEKADTFESCTIYLNDHPILLFSASSGISFVDPTNGDVLLSYDLGESIVRLISATPYEIRLITSSGKIATIWYRHAESSLLTVFPEGISNVTILSGEISDLDQFILLKDGNVYLFECDPDESLLLADEPGGGFRELPENLVICGDSAVLKVDTDLLLYHLPDLSVIKKKSYGDHKAIRLLGTVPEREAAVLLVIDMDSGTMLLELIDVTTGDSQASFKLSASEYFFESGMLDLFASYYDPAEELPSKRDLLQISYTSFAGGLTLKDSVLTYHDYVSPNTIHQLDLMRGEETVFTPDLSASQKLLNGSFESSLSPLLSSPDGQWLFSVVKEEDQDYRGVLIQAQDPDVSASSVSKVGNVRILSETESSSDLFAAWSQDSTHLAVTGRSSILLYQTDGVLITAIPYSGSRPLTLRFLSDGTLAVFYPGGDLVVYAIDGTILHELKLSYGELSYVMTSNFSFFETKDYLVVLCQEQLELVDLHDFGTRPVVTVPTHALGYCEATDQLLVYTYQYKDAAMKYHLGAFSRYSLDELIQKGYEALSGIAPK